MATDTDYRRLRQDIGLVADNTTALSDAEAEALFVEAGETYTGAASVHAAVRVIAIRRLLANAAKLTDYTQHNSQERAGQVFDHLRGLLSLWNGTLADAERTAGGTTVRFGRTGCKPARVREWPGS